MEPDELEDWRAGTVPACEACPVSFSDQMRPLGRCNGIPGESLEGIVVEPEPASRYRNRPVEIALLAPCDDCLHEPICALKAILAIQSAKARVAAPEFDPAFSVTLTARVDCSHFLPLPGRRRAKLQLSDAERTRRAEQARAMSAANAERKTEAQA